MPVYFTKRAFLSDGWAMDVQITVDEQGIIQRICSGSSDEGCQILSGPIVPGMPNLHSHAFQRMMSGLAEIAGNPQDSFWTWRDLMYRLVQQLTPEHIGVIARQLYIEMLKGGYTQVAEFHYLHHDNDGNPYRDPGEMSSQLSQAAQDAGIGMTLLPVLYSYAGFGAQPAQQGQRRFIQNTESYLTQQQIISKQLANQPLQNHGLCFHSLRAVELSQMQEVLHASDKQLPIHIHIAEQQKEVNDCLDWSGQRPVAWLYDHLPVDSRWCLIHATHLDELELVRLAKSQAVAGLCPTTEANLGDGIFPGVDYLQHQGRWGIGSDSHVSLDVVEELRWLEYGQRLRDQRRNRLTNKQYPAVADLLYTQALAGGRQACASKISLLAEGYRADWLVLDGDDPYIAGTESASLLNRWLFAGGKSQIRDVYVAGKAVIVDRYHPLQQQTAQAFLAVLKACQQEV
ncbi:formimidoylglutamate deiminase [Yersinia mollaretii]|uniref:N-formimino-L-glutamate deiminase n=1 Tax=Yersinia mollaretii TaxID=33060 RepID=A0AA36LNT0_YERMO|nr:formimidoylglutamate deiminase [Yersinia mollaretii]MDA5525777.1 formimidoylglutamate deiminase [Yersinia mollaretii]MDR7871880.1 formimidoylglutamate deiminase [Yersinia mollaretii]PHZ31989.1 formimidoylglutamate deiminase [Yersinia mollaretii]WQC73578.1 formimidoylglutamate deiminase [Yersinia mollaretii]CNH45734.1 N-formimino-L-glutamate deiminase [Yersinia mollaretii]